MNDNLEGSLRRFVVALPNSMSRLPALASLFLLSCALFADDAHEIEFFEREVRPLIVRRCGECHIDEEEGGLRLDSRQAAKQAGSEVIVPGDPDASLLIKAIRYASDLQMPPESKLPDDEIETLVKWVQLGAYLPTAPSEQPDDNAEAFEQRVHHWSFQPLRQSKPVTDDGTARTRIDQFISAAEKQRPRGIEKADRATLLRRVHFDLIGLPPTVDEVEEFLVDSRPTSIVFAETVDRLLANPHFGEKWARHWLDVVRYAETAGHVQDIERQNAWQYRDYVIRAFDQDLPYDRFIIEHLAGDLIAPRQDDQFANPGVAATGFLWFHEMHFKPLDPNKQRADQVDAQIDVTTKAFQGLTVACARCHDHKFDPIRQTDYYAMAGVFHSTVEASAQLVSLPRDLASHFEEQISAHEFAMAKVIEKGKKAAIADRKQKTSDIPPIAETVFAPNFKQQLRKLRNEIAQDIPQLAMWAPTAKDSTIVDTRLHVRGNHKRLADKVPRGFLSLLSNHPPYPNESSGRLDLARTIASADNPLTARVYANRIWQHLFGRGIVSTPSNFGLTGDPPTHPELLDYLAFRLIDSGWSTKSLIREIVLSDTYQMASSKSEATTRVAPNNWRFHRRSVRRLSAEAIRDAILTVAGSFHDARFGNSIPSDVSPNATANKRSHIPTSGPLDGAGRRSIYIQVRRNFLNPFLTAFDFPDPSTSVSHRNETLVPTQALAMMNSPFVNQQAQLWAQRELRQDASIGERAKHMFIKAIGRPPSESEQEILVQHVTDNNTVSGWTDVAHILFSLNDFMFVR